LSHLSHGLRAICGDSWRCPLLMLTHSLPDILLGNKQTTGSQETLCERQAEGRYCAIVTIFSAKIEK
jgi:hypothetical protein